MHFQPNEKVSALCPVLFGDDPQEYLAVGTAFVLEDEPEPLQGRLLLLQVSKNGDGKVCCTETAVLHVPGAVYSLVPFESMLLGSVNNRVCIWAKTDWLEGTRKHYQIREVCYYMGGIIALHLQAAGNHVLIGDVMRSIALLRYDAQESSLMLVASDEQSAWTTAVEIAGGNNFLMTDDRCNMYMLGQDESSSKSQRLHRLGEFHAGEFVNHLKCGNFGLELVDADHLNCSGNRHAVVWTSAGGAIGLIVSLSTAQQFTRLSLLQESVAQELALQKTELLPAKDWRTLWKGDGTSKPIEGEHQGFIDGDLLERFLSMTPEQQDSVTRRMVVPGLVSEEGALDQLVREVQEFAKLH